MENPINTLFLDSILSSVDVFFPSTPVIFFRLLTYNCVFPNFLVCSAFLSRMTFKPNLPPLVTTDDDYTLRAPAIIYPEGPERRTHPSCRYLVGPMPFMAWNLEINRQKITPWGVVWHNARDASRRHSTRLEDA